jgi:hypothetical protein
MSNVKISEKGKALLKNRILSGKVVVAIRGDNEGKLYSKEGLVVWHNGKKITIRDASSKYSKQNP